jgi:hypothetical protein
VQAKKKFAANWSDRDRRSMGRVNGNTIGTGAPWEESTVRRRLSKKESALSTRRSKRRANNDQKLKYEGKYSTLPDPVERTKSGVVQHALVEPGEQIDQKKNKAPATTCSTETRLKNWFGPAEQEWESDSHTASGGLAASGVAINKKKTFSSINKQSCSLKIRPEQIEQN